MAQRKEKAYIGKYEKDYQKNGKNSIMDRRKSIGKKLSFAAAEAYKLLRTNLIFSMADEDKCKVLGVTSALRGEGKSTTAINLAYTMAETGKKTLLIEADMRIPVMSDVLRMDVAPGLSHVLAGLNSLKDAVQQSRLLSSLYIIPAGEIPPNPSELLSSKRMEQVVQTLSESFDYIIIDLPPINAVSDGLTVSKLLTGMVMVVRQNYCDQYSLAEAMRQMEFLRVKVLGFVFNDAEAPEKRYKKYGGSYKYGKGDRYGYGYRRETSGKREAEGESAATI